jgi:hypothetical protein
LNFIGQWGIQTYDGHYENGIQAPTPGTISIIFEPNSKLSYIGDHGIAYRENVHLYFFNYINPKIHDNAFYRVKNIIIFSPSSFTFFNHHTNTTKNQYPYICSFSRKCTSFCLFKNINKYFIIYILISFNIFILLS